MSSIPLAAWNSCMLTAIKAVMLSDARAWLSFGIEKYNFPSAKNIQIHAWSQMSGFVPCLHSEKRQLVTSDILFKRHGSVLCSSKRIQVYVTPFTKYLFKRVS